MKIKLKLLKAHYGKKVGEEIEVSRDVAEMLIKQGIAEDLNGKKTVELLEDYEGQKAGEYLEFASQTEAKGLVDLGIAKFVDIDGDDEMVKDFNDAVEKAVSVKFAKFTKQMAKSSKAPFAGSVEVEENWEKDPQKGFKSFGTMAKDITTARTGGGFSEELSRYAKSFGAGQNESIGSDGGLLVPAGFSTAIKEHPSVNSSLDLASLTSGVAITGNSMSFLTAKDSDKSTDATRFAGVQTYWIKEGGTITVSKAGFDLLELKLKKNVALIPVTSELLEDSAVALESYLTGKVGMAMQDQSNEVIISGNGVNQPLGYLGHSGTVVVVPAVARTAAAPVTVDSLLKLRSRQINFGNSVWVINQDLFPVIAQLQIGNVFALTQGAINGNIDVLMGRPVLWTDLASASGTSGDIASCDFSGYQTITKNNGSVRVDSSIHMYFDTDQTAFRFIKRMDGQPVFKNVITPKNGNTRSSFVVLD
jgi:HK97 family phage major capsid protein